MPQPVARPDGRHLALIALGGNVTSCIGAPALTISEALRLLANDSVQVVARSRFYRTPAFPAGSGPEFVNAAACLQTGLPPGDLLAHLHDVETRLGRTRRTRWSERVIDLDLIAIGDAVLPDRDTYLRWHDLTLEDQQRLAPDGLILPHPRLQDRAFVLGPLCDIAPDWRHPVLNRSAAQLFAALPEADRAALQPLDLPD